MPEAFSLPSSSFEELQKIIKGYGHSGENASLDDLAKLTGINKTVISPNHKFLAQIGIITGGRAKSATELGKRLSRALDHNHDSDVTKYWREAVQSNEAVSSLVTTIRIKGGMSEEDFTRHVLYVSCQSNSSRNRTGARSVVDILTVACLIEEDEDGRLRVAVPTESASVSDSSIPEAGESIRETSTPATAIPPAILVPPTGVTPQIAINIQLHLPDTTDSEVYEKLFRALREQLISPKE